MSDTKHWSQHESTLQAIVSRAPFGLVTDIDGTISPIAATPQEAQVTTRAREALRSLTTKARLVAAVSGRGAADAHRMLDLPNVEIIGSHGLERWYDGEAVLIDEAIPYLETVRGALEEASPLIARFGITPEPKGITASLHYRNAPDRDSLRDAVYDRLADIAARHDLHLFEGRYIFELHPPLDVNKGTAVSALAAEYGLESLIFMGDDVTDLNAFKAVSRLRDQGRLDGAALGVVSTESPADVRERSDYTLHGVPDVEQFLDWLLNTLQ